MESRLQGLLERLVVGVIRRTTVLLAVLTASLLALGVGSAAAATAPAANPTPAATTATTTVAATTPTTAAAAPTPAVTTPGVLLCSGYEACSTNGFTTNGYGANEKTSWWRMYPGDNCTNYVAYVESQIFGVTEPTYLLGDADQWAANASANGVPVDDTPTVGAVAFWGAGALDMKRYGHVAIVQDVGPDNSYIDVSQSGMSKSDHGYDWERIYANSTVWESWPESFIHFPGTNISPEQAPAPPPPPPPAWPQVMLTQLTWGQGTITLSSTSLQLPTTLG